MTQTIYKQIIYLLVLSTLLIGQYAYSAALSGQITTAKGVGISGAMITVFNEPKTQKHTVFTNHLGQYLINIPFTGELTLRTRTPFYEDDIKKITPTNNQPITTDIILSQLKSEEDLSKDLSASAHVATLEWADDNVRTAFITQCNYCHQIGNSLTRRPRSHTKWVSTVKRMEFLAMLTDDESSAIADSLYNGFDGEPVKTVQTHDNHPALAEAKIEEWLVGDGMSFIHDADIGSNGKLYGTDQGHDILWELDLQTNKIEQYPLPDSDLPVGGLFSGLKLPIGIFTGKHGPHSLAEDKSGKFWITGALSSTLISFDTQTKVFKEYPIGEDILYPHTIRIDNKGIIWFTNAVSNQISRFDPTTETFTHIDLPSNGIARWLTDAFFPLILKISAWWPGENMHLALSHHKLANQGRNVLAMPYGIDINPLDGKVWYAKLMSNKLGVIDPETFTVKEFDTPLSGPRRPRFDSNGILWIPAFDDSALLRFDPQSETFKTYQLPVLADNEWETPYALNVHPKTNDIWITSNNSDRIFRFNQNTETFVSYPSPTRVSFLRDLVFTEDGKICSSQSNLPAYAIEGGRPSFICIDPAGALQN